MQTTVDLPATLEANLASAPLMYVRSWRAFKPPVLDGLANYVRRVKSLVGSRPLCLFQPVRRTTALF